MNLNEQNSSASDEVAAAEAELRAAQETLKAARARLSELKGEHPAVEPGAASSDVVGDGEPVEAFGVAAVVVDEDTAEVEAVIFEAEAVSADDGSQRPTRRMRTMRPSLATRPRAKPARQTSLWPATKPGL